MTAKSVSHGPTTGSMKPWNTTAGTAQKPPNTVVNFTKPANIAGSTAIAGGAKMTIAGTLIVTGMTTTTITTMIITDNFSPVHA